MYWPVIVQKNKGENTKLSILIKTKYLIDWVEYLIFGGLFCLNSCLALQGVKRNKVLLTYTRMHAPAESKLHRMSGQLTTVRDKNIACYLTYCEMAKSLICLPYLTTKQDNNWSSFWKSWHSLPLQTSVKAFHANVIWTNMEMHLQLSYLKADYERKGMHTYRAENFDNSEKCIPSERWP